ncbi:hypothetical protein [Mycobacterium sp. CnD-18-1]|uniref:hypothetical protein n=1 Tax=Mycobacterium sp. CnD-18-1 TaxID=2917744 RepID=UPI001EF2B141|nr:hypothetical protein [Mycobacterium sp. CnD-18-1]MCG7607065.1 hypothetical protein [Mycobacterium sp. CnD-18-1]
MGGDWAAVISQWPWLVLLAVFIFGIPHAVKAAKALKTFLWDPFITYLRGIDPLSEEREQVNARIDDLQKQVDFLNEQVGELRYRDRMYWAWVVSDQEYHRRIELMAVEHSWELPVHISFDEFYDEWTRKHPMPKPYQP